MDPLGRRILGASERGTRRVSRQRVRRAIDVKGKEEHGGPFLRFHAEPVSIVPSARAERILLRQEIRLCLGQRLRVRKRRLPASSGSLRNINTVAMRFPPFSPELNPS